LVGYKVGYTSRELEQFHHTFVLHDVRVLSQRNAYNFRMAVDNLPFEATFCPGNPPQIGPGMTLKLLVYEQAGPCKNISDDKLGYIVSRDSSGNPIVDN